MEVQVAGLELELRLTRGDGHALLVLRDEAEARAAGHRRVDRVGLSRGGDPAAAGDEAAAGVVDHDEGAIGANRRRHAAAFVVVGDRELHGIDAGRAERVDIAHRPAAVALGDRPGDRVAVEGPLGGVSVSRARVGERAGEGDGGVHRVDRAHRRPADGNRRLHVGPGDGGDARVAAAVLVGRGQRHHVAAVVVRREAEARPRPARAVGGPILGHRPRQREGRLVDAARVGRRAGQADRGALRAGAWRARDRRRRGDVGDRNGLGICARPTVVIGRGEGDDVGAVVVRREAQAGGRPGGVREPVLAHAPGQCEARRRVRSGGGADRAAQRDRRALGTRRRCPSDRHDRHRVVDHHLVGILGRAEILVADRALHGAAAIIVGGAGRPDRRPEGAVAGARAAVEGIAEARHRVDARGVLGIGQRQAEAGALIERDRVRREGGGWRDVGDRGDHHIVDHHRVDAVAGGELHPVLAVIGAGDGRAGRVGVGERAGRRRVDVRPLGVTPLQGQLVVVRVGSGPAKRDRRPFVARVRPARAHGRRPVRREPLARHPVRGLRGGEAGAEVERLDRVDPRRGTRVGGQGGSPLSVGGRQADCLERVRAGDLPEGHRPPRWSRRVALGDRRGQGVLAVDQARRADRGQLDPADHDIQVAERRSPLGRVRILGELREEGGEGDELVVPAAHVQRVGDADCFAGRCGHDVLVLDVRVEGEGAEAPEVAVSGGGGRIIARVEAEQVAPVVHKVANRPSLHGCGQGSQLLLGQATWGIPLIADDRQHREAGERAIGDGVCVGLFVDKRDSLSRVVADLRPEFRREVIGGRRCGIRLPAADHQETRAAILHVGEDGGHDVDVVRDVPVRVLTAEAVLIVDPHQHDRPADGRSRRFRAT
ncbi:MAG: hypothetical protein AVDCRST_MAG18-3581 [uncultured Thermomicrobiales bacterium]|uniref:Uncharacterized protein n=1 Tax=uncultured Thermomicrobiales bacterium TaxID=1645740 RepID=A0A6J4VNL1_9BACT|nr:MAG: hypothetical protein AVDCRST_MAG18-3581 [uncultured Thermomicrobiales bacterium]